MIFSPPFCMLSLLTRNDGCACTHGLFHHPNQTLESTLCSFAFIILDWNDAWLMSLEFPTLTNFSFG